MNTSMSLDRHTVRLLLEDSRMSQRDLAAATGISQSQISRIMRGIQKPSDEQEMDIAKALGVPVVRLSGVHPADSDESRLLREWKRLPPKARTAVIDLIRKLPC